MEKIVAKIGLNEKYQDHKYWLAKSPVERIEALEEIRSEYNKWKYGNANQRLQRVYKIIKQK